MKPREKVFAAVVIIAITGVTLWMVIRDQQDPEPLDPRPAIEAVKSGAAHVTRKAGEHAARGVIDGVKGEIKDAWKNATKRFRKKKETDE